MLDFLPRSGSLRQLALAAILVVPLYLLTGFFAPQASAQPTGIFVISPTSNANWVVDTTYKIKWYTSGAALVGKPLLIQYSSDSMATWHLIDTIAASIAGQDSIAWKIPNDTTHKAFVRISVIGDTTVGTSRRFNITKTVVPVLTVTNPLGGTYSKDSVMKIRWNGQYLAGKTLTAEFSIDSMKTWTIINPFLAGHEGADSLSWTVPGDSTNSAFIRVRANDSSVSAVSRWFAIRLSYHPFLLLLYPNGGEVFQGDSSIVIRWRSTDLTGMVTAFYSIDSGAKWTMIGSAPAINDSIAWRIPNVSTIQALVRLQNAAATDVSDSVFAISENVNPVLTLVSPNGGGVYKADSAIYIKWSAANIGTNIDVEWSPDSGATWRAIASRPPVNGRDSISWIVPDSGTNAALVRVRTEDGSIESRSARVFTVVGKPLVGIFDNETVSLAMHVQAFPNPASEQVRISWVQPTLANTLIRVYASDGSLIRELALGIVESGTQQHELNVGDLAAGNYRFQVQSGTMRAAGGVTIVR